MKKTFFFTLFILLLFVFAISAVSSTFGVITFKYDDFTNSGLIKLDGQNGYAKIINDSSTGWKDVIRLTPTTGGKGTAYYKNYVSLANDRSFSTYFTFKIIPVGAGADGMVFILNTDTNEFGSGGGGMGYAGMDNSIGIEFDTYDNSHDWGGGTPSNTYGDDGLESSGTASQWSHIAVNVNGDINNPVATASNTEIGYHFKDQSLYHVWIDYDGLTDTLEVRINQNSNERPATAIISTPLDLAGILKQDEIYAGFSATTGGSKESHDIYQWYFNNDFTPIDIVNNNYVSAPSVSLTAAHVTDTETTLTAVLTNADGSLVSNKQVAFSTNLGTLSGTTTTTNENGEATVTLTNNTNGGAYVKAAAAYGAYDEVIMPPSVPTLADSTTTSITLTPIVDAEYKMDDGEWQSSNLFSGLSMNTEYTFYARMKETPTSAASATTTGVTFSTLPYTVTYDGNGNTGGAEPNDPSIYEYGTTVTVLGQGDLERVGYTFSGWTTNADGTGTTYEQNDTFPMGPGDITLYAKWIINEYTVTFLDYDGTVLKTETITHGSSATPPADPTREGYTFTGWDKTYDNVTSDLEVTAQYSINEYNVSFVSNGGSAVDFIKTDYGTTITEPAVPTRTGYTFEGWHKEAELTNQWDFGSDTIPAEDISLYAKWDTVDYSIAYNLDGGINYDNAPTSYTIETGTIPLGTPTKAGYDFLGWYDAETGGNQVTQIENGSIGNKTLCAKWEPVVFTINAIENKTMAVLEADYGSGSQETKVITITRTGTGDLTNLAVALGGLNASDFEITQPLVTILNNGTPSTSFTVKAKEGLAAGTYTAAVTVSADNMTDETFNITQVINAPDAPTLQPAIAGNSHVSISWSPVSGATGYKIFVSTTSGSYGAALETVADSVYSYNAAGLTNGTTYYFVVRTVIGSSESANSNEVNATPQVPAPGAPVIQTAVTGDSHVNISWSEVSGATGYKVFSSTTSGSYGTAAATVAGSVYSYDVTSLNNGTTYYFTVKATNPGGDSAASNEVSATPQAPAPSDTTVPTLTAGAATRTGNTTGTVRFTSDEAGTYYYKIVADNEAAPTIITINAATYDGTAATGAAGSEIVITNPIGLTAGTKDIYIVVKDSAGNVSNALKIDIAAYTAPLTYTATVSETGTYTFAAVTAGYTSVTPHTVTVTRTGTGIITNLVAALSGGDADSFTLGDLEAITLDSTTTNTTFTVKPNDGLATGTYSATVTVTADNGINLDFNVSFTVSAVSPTIPGAPTNVKATAGNGQAVVSFTAPTYDGGSPIERYIVTSNPGNVTKEGTGTTITVTGLTNGTTYTFTVQAVNAVGDGPASAASNEVTPYRPSNDDDSDDSEDDEPSTSTAPSTPAASTASTSPGEAGVDILVNGKAETAATATTTVERDKTVITVIVDDKKVEEKLQQAGSNAVVTIPVKDSAEVVIGTLNGQTVKNMEVQEAILEIKTDHVTYTLPASQINIDAVSQQIGTQVALKDIAVYVKISEPTPDTVKIVEVTAKKDNYQIVVKPVTFEITCLNGGKTVAVSKFNAYVERMVAIPEGINPVKTTTGVVLNADGTFTHVPTTITIIDGKYYAKINSLTNSTYSVIYNPKAFKDVEGHWAMDAVNDMGSRLVIDGVGDGSFEPERDISRAEFAAIAVKALGLMRPDTGKTSFRDVTKTDWYYDAVSIAYEYGLISVYDSGEFGPNDKISREQAMIIIARAMKITGLKTERTKDEMNRSLEAFTDTSMSSDYARYDIAACIEAGIVSGRDGKLLAPQDNITRAETAVIIRKLLQISGLI